MYRYLQRADLQCNFSGVFYGRFLVPFEYRPCKLTAILVTPCKELSSCQRAAIIAPKILLSIAEKTALKIACERKALRTSDEYPTPLPLPWWGQQGKGLKVLAAQPHANRQSIPTGTQRLAFPVHF